MRRLLLPLAAAVAMGVAACGADSGTVTDRALPPLTNESTTTSAPPGPTTTTTSHCPDPTTSYAPLSPVPDTQTAVAADAFMKKIHDRGHLRVAVDETTKHLAARNTVTSDLEGAEIEIAKAVARHIFGVADDTTIQFTTVTTKEKLEFPRDGRVDMSISAISMTCERRDDVTFSSVYLSATPTFLVRGESAIRSTEQLAGKRVCVTVGSTSVGLMERINGGFEHAGAERVAVIPVDLRTDCLLKLQEGMVDAYLGHDTFLVGMREQNPSLAQFDAGSGEQQQYGIAINKDTDHVYFVQYVNGVLQELRDNGRLQDLLREVYKTVPPVPPTRALPPVSTTRALP